MVLSQSFGYWTKGWSRKAATHFKMRKSHGPHPILSPHPNHDTRESDISLKVVFVQPGLSNMTRSLTCKHFSTNSRVMTGTFTTSEPPACWTQAVPSPEPSRVFPGARKSLTWAVSCCMFNARKGKSGQSPNIERGSALGFPTHLKWRFLGF